MGKNPYKNKFTCGAPTVKEKIKKEKEKENNNSKLKKSVKIKNKPLKLNIGGITYNIARRRSNAELREVHNKNNEWKKDKLKATWIDENKSDKLNIKDKS